MKQLLTLGVLAASLAFNVSATTVIGYSNGNQGRTTLFRTMTEHTGLAVKIPAEKVKLLKGCTISALDVSVGSIKSNDGCISLFVTTSLDGTPVVNEKQDITRANAWITHNLPAPYTITGDEPALYIGYTIDIPSSYSPLSADHSVQMNDVTYALYDTEWRDVKELGVGQGNVRMVLDRDPAITDLLFKPLNFNGFYKDGQDYEFSGQLFNFGTSDVNEFTVKLQIGDSTPEYYPITESIAPGSTYNFKIPSYTAKESGNLQVSLSVEDVNGGLDSDPTDNKSVTKTYFYPAEMERAILLEGFTGQDCSNCPAGHRTIETVLANWEKAEGHTEIIEVMHHAGYYPDYFTMKEDMEYVTLYSGSSFAPAVTVNRRWCSDQNAPVFNVSETNLNNMLQECDAAMPYVSLSLESDFDAETRKLDVKVSAYTHNEIPEEIKTINVMLCQNNLVSRQSGGGSEYNHSHVFRGTLTNNAWGVQRDFVPSTTEVYEASYIIPDSIHSSYWTEENMANISEKRRKNYDIEAVPEEMYLVAYVGTFDANSNSKRIILNCAQAPLGTKKVQNGFSGIESVSTDNGSAAPSIRVSDGFVVVDAACRSIEIYNLQGARIANGHVSGSMFIIRAVTEAGNIYVKKVLAK